MDAASSGAGQITGRHVLVAFVLFFGTVIAVNAYFLTVALSTYSGVVANEPYRKGLKYNERIAADERQHELGWSEEIALVADGRRLTVTLHASDGAPVAGLALRGSVGRPATSRGEVTLAFEEAAAGRYETAVKLDGSGAFIASVETQDEATGAMWRVRKRLWLER